MSDTKDRLQKFFEGVLYRKKEGIHSRGEPTGILELDEIISGFAAPDLVVLAARPGMGKTALATQLILNQISKGKPCIFFSIEMDFSQVASRLLSQKTGIPLGNILTARLSDSHIDKIRDAISWLSELPLVVDDNSSPTLGHIESRLRSSGPLGLAVVDYLGILNLGSTSGGMTREGQISEASQLLKKMARDFDVPLLLLSQLNRQCESRNDKRPLLGDLRDSGQVEANADCVLMLYRDWVYDREADPDELEILVRKHRHGPLGEAYVKWDPETTRVYSRVSGKGSELSVVS